jgi:hypothetical protein
VNKLLLTLFFYLAVTCASAQDLMQVVRGKISDRLTGIPMAGAGIRLVGSAGEHTSVSDEHGIFSITAPIGRYKLSVSFTGYQTFHDEVLLIAARELVVNVAITRGETVLEAVEVRSSTAVDDLPGLQSLSVEKTLRVPANFFDPVRVVTAYPAVVAANDQSNAIIVRGNSPNGLLWRLNGLNIVNPNHLSNAGTLSDRPASNGGGVNILSAQMLDRTDFYFGAMPPNYGNALAGVVDMKLRDGSRTSYEYTAQASLIGLDVAAEGPFTKKQNSSFVANYRYSTVGLLSAIGVNFGDEAITFQDLSFHGSADIGGGGKFSFFGFWGFSSNEFEGKESDEWEEDKDKYDIEYQAETYALGANYAVPLAKGKFSAGLAYSASEQERQALISSLIPQFERNVQSDEYRSSASVVSSNIRYERRAGEKNSVEIGVVTDLLSNDVASARVTGCFICGNTRIDRVSGDSKGALIQPYLNLASALSPVIGLNAGIRYVNYTFNATSAVEPRIGFSVKPSNISGLNVAYSLVSQTQLPQTYYSGGNEDLGFTRSHHVDLNYWQHVTEGMKLRGGIFYQYLFDVPVEQDPASTFSTLNIIDEAAPADLVNEGTGENYGVEATIEKYFYSSTYMLLGGSYYESTFVAADGIERDSRFNGNYTFNGLYGKEWIKPSRNRTIGVTARMLYLGGLRESRVVVAKSIDDAQTVYDDTDPYSEQLKDYFRVDLRVSFRKNKPGYTRTFALDIQNLSGNQNEASHYYDMTQGKVVTKYQLGIIPILVYRIDF